MPPCLHNAKQATVSPPQDSGTRKKAIPTEFDSGANYPGFGRGLERIPLFSPAKSLLALAPGSSNGSHTSCLILRLLTYLILGYYPPRFIAKSPISVSRKLSELFQQIGNLKSVLDALMHSTLYCGDDSSGVQCIMAALRVLQAEAHPTRGRRFSYFM